MQQSVLEKLFPDHFLKNQNWSYLPINILKFYIFCFYSLPSWGLSKVIETKLQTTCFYLIKSFFKKRKEVWNWSPCLICFMIFEEKYFWCYILLPDQMSMPGCLYFVRYGAICILQLFVNQVVTSKILKLASSS